jgi:hypothetical protein
MNMKRFLLIVIPATVLAVTQQVRSQQEDFGLGIVVGEPTGISAKYWISQTTAIDGAVAWSFSHSGSFYIHADYLKHHFEIIDISEGRMPFYYGIGGKMVLANKGILGVHFPLGMAYMFDTAPLDIFIEIRPGLNLLPSTSFDISGGIGVRYYFSQ